MTVLRRYPSFTAFLAAAILVGGALAAVIDPARAFLGGFIAGGLVFLALVVRAFSTATPATMRARAVANAPDHHLLLASALVIVIVVIVAVSLELADSRGRNGPGIALAAISLALSWLFTNTLFALHYAHLWYLPAGDDPAGDTDSGGLDFPGGESRPDFWDFAYFAFVLGMTFQVSDVVITGRRLRRLALFHAMIAFVFNIGVVALTVSLVAAVLGG